MNLRNKVALGIVGLLAAGGALSAVGTPAVAATKGCESPILERPERASDVATSKPRVFEAAAKRNAGKVRGFSEEAKHDKSIWLDRCGDAFYVDAGPSAGERAQATATMGAQASGAELPFAGVPLTETFTLNSKPGSNRTIYLDFKGGTVTGTAWNNSYGSTITWEPYSIDSTVSTAFSDAELVEIQKVWQVVAEDYAAFDVNVTTQDPGVAAIDRTSSSDLVYGTRAAITNGGVIYDKCGCGGVAYVGVYNTTGSTHMYYQPAWVFSNGTTKNGKYIGEATSHEIGHNFGLNHDDVNGSGYYSGSSPWAPIMGASYSQPVSQWSTGEYPGGTNHQDDVAQIATGAPFRADEDTAGPLPLANGGQATGIVSRASDVDSYTFTAAGTTTVTVDSGGPFPDLDVQLTIVDVNGTTVASANPTTARVSATQASGMNASATFTAPAGGATYTARIQGAGQGDPTAAGGYSNYGSLGAYRIGLTTQPGGEPSPLALSVGTLPNGTVGSPYSASVVSASGGVAPYTYAATGLPSGLTLNTSNGGLTGTPTASGSFSPVFTVTDSQGATASRSGSLSIAAAPAPLAWVTGATLPSGKRNVTYSTTLSVTGGAPAYTWTRTSGKFPNGLSLVANGTTATLSGKPSKNGTYAFTLRVTDGRGISITRSFTVTIAR